MSMFSKLTKAGVKAEFTTGGASIQDAELDPRGLREPLEGDHARTFAIEALVFGVSRRRIEGSPYPEPLEVWHLFQETRAGGISPRTIRGRRELAGIFSHQAAQWGLAFMNADTGALELSPAGEGKWILVRAADGAKSLMLARIGLDPKRGKLAGQGRAFAYNVAVQAVAVAQARVAYPELVSLPMDAMLSLPLDDEPTQITDSGAAPRSDAGAPADDGTAFEPADLEERELVTTGKPVTSSKRRK